MVGKKQKGPFPPALAAAPAILACLPWSSAFAAVKTGLRHMPPLTFAGMRFLLAGLLLLPLCGSPRQVPGVIKRHRRHIATVSVLQTVVLYAAYFWGMSLVQGAQGAVIIGASPLVVALMAHFFMPDDRMTLPKAGTIAPGLVGVLILATGSHPWSPTGLRELGGMGLLLICVCSSAAANVFVARHPHPINPILLNSVQIGTGGVVLLVAGLVVHGPPAAVPPPVFFAALLWLAVVSAAAFSIWFFLPKRMKVSQLNMWKFLISPMGAALSWLLLPDESPNLPTAAGAICVAAAVLRNQRYTAKTSPPTKPTG